MPDETSCVGCRYLDITQTFDAYEYYCLRYSKLILRLPDNAPYQPPKPRRHDCYVTRAYTKSEDSE